MPKKKSIKQRILENVQHRTAGSIVHYRFAVTISCQAQYLALVKDWVNARVYPLFDTLGLQMYIERNEVDDPFPEELRKLKKMKPHKVKKS